VVGSWVPDSTASRGQREPRCGHSLACSWHRGVKQQLMAQAVRRSRGEGRMGQDNTEE
jgi:hypothetical protein